METNKRFHHTMVDFCVDMKPEHVSLMLNDHYSEFVGAYPNASKVADNGDDIKFIEEDGSLKIIMNKGMDANIFTGQLEQNESCTSIILE